MVAVTKIEHHSMDLYHTVEIDREVFGQIYSDIEDEAEIDLMFLQFENGDLDIDDVINAAWENSVDIDWEFSHDDLWTDRKGGYEVSYELDV
jgi:hypothetical protein